MDAKEMEAVADTLMRLATPGMKPKDLIKAVRRQHPGASKKDIARAAFYSIIARADEDPSKAKALQAFAIEERIADEA